MRDNTPQTWTLGPAPEEGRPLIPRDIVITEGASLMPSSRRINNNGGFYSFN